MKVFTTYRVAKEMMVDCVTFMLCRVVAYWWRSIKAQLSVKPTWDWFIQVFYKRFFPNSVQQRMLVKSFTLKQWDMTVEEYGNEPNQLMKFMPPTFWDDENSKIQNFLIRLKLSTIICCKILWAYYICCYGK